MLRIDQLKESKGPQRELGDLSDLIESILAVGVLLPIIVDKDGNIIDGHRRVAACLALGLKVIPAIVIAQGTIQQRIAAIDANLCRKNLTLLERSEWLAERKTLYETLHPEARHGGAPGKAGGGKRAKDPGSGSFVTDTAHKTGRGRSTVAEDVRITSIVPDVRDKLRATPLANRKGDLLRLAKCKAHEQRTIAKVLLDGDVSSVAAAQKYLAGNESTGSALEEAPQLKRCAGLLRKAQQGLTEVQSIWANNPDDPTLPLFEEACATLADLIDTVDQRLVPQQECDCQDDHACPSCGGKGWLCTSDLESEDDTDEEVQNEQEAQA